MIFDIDMSESVFKTVHAITAGWFDASKLYWKLKEKSETESPDFWHNTEHLLRATANQLGQSLDIVILKWRSLCIEKNVSLMGYHCSRYHQQDFRNKGIIPLTEQVINNFFSEIELAFPTFKLSTIHKNALTEIIKRNDIWKYRVGRDCGPHFFLSYKSAKNSVHDFYKTGFEIGWLFVDEFLKY